MSSGEGMAKAVERETKTSAIESALVSLGVSVRNLETFLKDADHQDSDEDKEPDPCRSIIALIEHLPEDLLSLKEKINSLVTKCREAFL